jgi:hypothetical protein
MHGYLGGHIQAGRAGQTVQMDEGLYIRLKLADFRWVFFRRPWFLLGENASPSHGPQRSVPSTLATHHLSGANQSRISHHHPAQLDDADPHTAMA